MTAVRFAGLLLLAAAPALCDSRHDFQVLCAACHGADGAGGERAPGLRRAATQRTPEDLKQVVRRGIPQRGMPAFDLAEERLAGLVNLVRSLFSPAATSPVEGDASKGKDLFFGSAGCSDCHMAEGRGTAFGPDLSRIAKERTVTEIERSLLDPNAVMAAGYKPVRVQLQDGSKLEGLARNASNFDLQLQDRTGKLHLLTAGQIAETEKLPSPMPRVRLPEADLRNLLAYLTRLDGTGPAPPSPNISIGDFERIVQPQPGEWPTYNGSILGNRHSPLDAINEGNVASLAPRWMFPIRDSQRLQVTPLVMDGVMYVTTANQAYALDAATGRQIWHFRRERTKGLAGDAASNINRGVALLGDRVFLSTDNAHLLALHRVTGALLWETAVADSKENYGTTSAPLVVNDLVVTGTSGGDEGARGLIAAFRAATGEKVWQVWTVPLPGEPGSETWGGSAIAHGCGTTWLTGTYDPDGKLLYWTTGNPCPDYNGDERKGDNLYTDSVLALDPATGKLRWHFQFTPHDLHDWDAVQTPILVDAAFRGEPRKLLLQGNRNGFFYVLDRLTGEFLNASAFAKQTWADGMDSKGRPKLLPGSTPAPAGAKVCPAVEGASNWMSAAYNPSTGLFYLMALDKCTIYSRADAVWKAGQSYYGGDTRDVPNEPGQKVLRALDLQTGKLVWEVAQTGPANSWGGVLSTAGGLVFYGDDSGAFAAVSAKTGKPLWHFHTNQLWKASPMTYMVKGTQYIAVAAGGNVLAFALP